MNAIKLSVDDKVIKARYWLNRDMPSFAILVSHLNFINTDKVPTAGVDAKGNFYFNPDFIEKLSVEEMKGLFTHEVLHLAYNHPKRGKGKTVQTNAGMLYNIAGDIVINNVILNNGMALPKGGLEPKNNSIVLGDITIDSIDEKSADEIYYEIAEQMKQGKDAGNEGNFDEHIEWDKEGQGSGEGEGKGTADGTADGTANDSKKGGNTEKNWEKLFNDALAYGKLIGKVPAGFEREFSSAFKPQINWRTVLAKAIAQCIPSDWTWTKPNRKYVSQGIYLPAPIKEEVKVIFSIDTSGSMSNDELSQIIAELKHCARSFSNLSFRVITWDTEVHDDYALSNGGFKKIDTLELHGGGGSDMTEVYKYIKQKGYMNTTKLHVAFTDGYVTMPERTGVQSLFILVGNHANPYDFKKYGRTICLEQ